MSDEYLMQLPYRKLSLEEREQARDRARNLINGGSMIDGVIAINRIWKSTRTEGLNMVETIKILGYCVCAPTYSTGDMNDPAEEHSTIISKGGHGIGNIYLWKEWGFLENPVSVSAYRDGWTYETVDEAFRLHTALQVVAVEHSFNPSYNELREKFAEVNVKRNLMERALKKYNKF